MITMHVMLFQVFSLMDKCPVVSFFCYFSSNLDGTWKLVSYWKSKKM